MSHELDMLAACGSHTIRQKALKCKRDCVRSVLVILLSTTGQGIAEICDGRKDLYLAETLYTKLTKLRRRFHRTQGESEPYAVEAGHDENSLEEISKAVVPVVLGKSTSQRLAMNLKAIGQVAGASPCYGKTKTRGWGPCRTFTRVSSNYGLGSVVTTNR